MPSLFLGLVLAALSLAVAPGAQAMSATEIFAKTRQAVYMLIVTGDEPGVVDVIAQGSAVLIAPGRFVTNCHVLQRGKHFVISRREDRIVERVHLTGFGKGKDLCELDLAQPKAGFDHPVDIAPTESLHIGQPVFAIGSPRGMELTISNGIVSGFRESGAGMKLIQTTAPFSAGSSGGGLFDDEGRLVGITTLVAKDAQNLNFAVPAQYIASAGLSAAELLRQRGGAAEPANVAATEIAFERQERLRREEVDQIAVRKRQLEVPAAPVQDKPADAANARRTPRLPAAARLAPYQGMGADDLPAKTYARMSKSGGLDGLDDVAAVRRVYEALIYQRISDQMRWNEGGNYVSEFQVQLRRSGEVMFVMPVHPSGVERFDEEAQRAIGASSPFPVPQDNEVFSQMSELTIAVQAPVRKAVAPPEHAAAKKKRK